METADIVLVIGITTSSIVTIIGAIFAGWVALKQLPKQAAEIQKVTAKVGTVTATVEDPKTGVKATHEQGNSALKKLEDIIVLRDTEIARLNAETRTDAIDRAQGQSPDPIPVVIVPDAPVPVTVVEPEKEP